MPISTYADLQTEIQEWMDRNDIAGKVPTMISLAEANLNRELKTVETDAALVGIVGSRSIDISSLSFVEPIALKIKVIDQEYDVILRDPGSIDYSDISGEPGFYGFDGTNIVFNCPCDQVYPFRFRYQGRFALSDAAPTNRLLTEHPDVYLAASIVWGGLFTQDDRKISNWSAVLSEGLEKVKHTLAQAKRSTLVTDPMIASIGTPYWGWFPR